MCGGGGGGNTSANLGQARKEAGARRLAADQKAQGEANASTAARRTRQRSNSLLATGARGVTSNASTSSVLAMGKTTLGGA